ncbi:MAG: glycosyltransferase [Fervidicoccaceae archaeon]
MLDEVTVIIPTKNEREGISRVIEEVKGVGIKPDRIIVVDGNSKDGTPELAKELGAKVIRQKGDGKADAVKQGLEEADTKYALVMDGDGTYPAKHIPELLEKARKEECGLVLGVRREGRENIGILNRFGNWILNRIFNFYFGVGLNDILTGMYLIDREKLKASLFEMKGFSIEAELVSYFTGVGEKVCEVPIEYRSRLGEKKLKVWHGILIGRDIIRLAWRYSPVSFIFFLSSVLLIPGILIGAYVAYYYFLYDINYYVKGIAAITMTSSGFIAFLLGILSLYLKRMEIRLKKMIESLSREMRES